MWEWSADFKKNFEELIRELADATHLAQFHPKIPLILAAVALQFGIGAVISHRQIDSSEEPIAHASKTLSKSERNYNQIEKESLALVFGVRKFHQFLYGREFVLLTDHKPLVTVFGSEKGIPLVTANRLRRGSRLPVKSTELFDQQDFSMD